MTMAQIPTASPAYNLQDDDTEEIDYCVELTTDVKKCYSLGRTVKWLASVDLFFATIYAFFNYYFLIPMTLIAFGYIGAKKYKITYTVIYLIYTIIINISRLYVFYKYYYSLDVDNRASEMFDFIIVISCFIIGLWISRIIYRFSYLLKKLTSDELEFLRQLTNYHDYTIILW